MTASRYFSGRSRLYLALIAILIVGGLLFSVRALEAGPAHAFGGVGPCQAVNVPNLALAAGQPAQYTIYGELCRPSYGGSRTVQILIHGGTYSHLYWDWPSTPDHPDWSSKYSGVHYLTSYGFTTFNIDRIGIGQSSHPASSLIDIPANAYIVHELVGLLRSGGIGGITFYRVNLIGHSLGSLTSMIEANTYHDVDAVILTSLLHIVSQNGLKLIQLAPANQDPSGRFASLDSGYLTTVPNTRSGPFYYAPSSDPAVIAYDEQTKETLTPGELNGLANMQSQQINVPVLLIMGQNDILHCAADAVDCSSSSTILKEEAPYYSAQAQLQVDLIPNTGHDLNLHTTAHQTYSAIVHWLWNQNNQ